MSYVKCPICLVKFNKFEPYGYPQRPNRMCPQCGSLERHRTLKLFLERYNFDLRSRRIRLLDIAPTKGLINFFKSHQNIEYISIDLNSPLAMYHMDISRLINFPDGYFDIVVCYHVLEHIKEDEKALREIYRVLKPGGFAIVQVPMRKDSLHTIEGRHIEVPQKRAELFGQPDHYRYYGLDFKQKCENIGFQVEIIGVKNIFSEFEVKEYKLCEEDIYILKRPDRKYSINKLSQNEYEISGFKFLDIRGLSPDKIPPYEQRIPIAKPADMIKWYIEFYYNKDIRNVLEFGIFYGGSAILWNVLFRLEKYVGIDLSNERKGLKEFLEHFFPNKNVLLFNHSQSDEIKIKEIIEKEFNGRIDLIIDDASHLFELSLKSFEISFPYLRPYGYYVIEDWGWSHWLNFDNYEPNKKGLPSLTNLAFLLTMASASCPNIIKEINIVSPSLLLIQRGPAEITIKSEFSLHKMININNQKSLIYLSEQFFEMWKSLKNAEKDKP